ncbi:MAG: hypothetical protein KAX19_09060, partial [Candidatus Brocadiae bacterium]|nr:hypothetical protein [Candidatus Brocadiia bacterium]
MTSRSSIASSPYYLLPGLDTVPQNTLGLVRTNQRFLESYMVGLNHEMARELLWREYPTDQRGTYFRQFWDVAEVVPSDELLEELEADVRAGLTDSELDAQEDPDAYVAGKVEEALAEYLKEIGPIHGLSPERLGQNARDPQAAQ